MTRVPCRACQKRKKAARAREALLNKRAIAKRAKGQRLSAKMDEAQAAALGAFLTTTALVGRLIGEEESTQPMIAIPNGFRQRAEEQGLDVDELALKHFGAKAIDHENIPFNGEVEDE